jgi:hypothetical protein
MLSHFTQYRKHGIDISPTRGMNQIYANDRLANMQLFKVWGLARFFRLFKGGKCACSFRRRYLAS